MAANTNCKIPVGLAAALEELGASPRDVLATAGLPSRLFDVPGQRLPVREYFALWGAVAAVSGDPGVGLALARAVKPDHTEPLFLAMLSAVSVADALDVVATYKRILSPESFVVHRDADAGEVVVTYAWPEAELATPQALVDAELAFLVEMCRRGTRDLAFAPRRVHLRAAALAAPAAHAAYFRCAVRLGAPANAVAFAAAQAATPFLTHNPQMLGALVPYLRANTPPAPTSVVARARAVIAERLRGQRPTVQTVGKELAMSSRALQRALKDSGTSFRQVLDEVRNEHARGYLGATAFNDTEVAFLLGFEDPNSFYRAFRTWNGMSPSEYRRRPTA